MAQGEAASLCVRAADALAAPELLEEAQRTYPNTPILIDDKSVSHLLPFALLPHHLRRYFGSDIIADPCACYCSRPHPASGGQRFSYCLAYRLW
jgi:hypothetical protein